MPSSMRNSYPSNVAKNVVIETIVQQDVKETPVEVESVSSVSVEELNESVLEVSSQDKTEELSLITESSDEVQVPVEVTETEVKAEETQSLVEESSVVEVNKTNIETSTTQEETIVLSSSASYKKKKR